MGESMDDSSRDADFTAFVVARSGRLVRLAQMLCGDRQLAEDLVQTALEKAYVRWSRIERDPFDYVRRAVVNQHVSRLRRRPWRELAVGGSAEIDLGPVPAVADHAAGVHRRELVTSALRTLSRRERAMVVLRYVEDVSAADTAEVMGVSVNTVKSTTSRALAKLRARPELIDVYEGEPA